MVDDGDGTERKDQPTLHSKQERQWPVRRVRRAFIMQEDRPCWTEGKKKPWARKEDGWASGSFLESQPYARSWARI